MTNKEKYKQAFSALHSPNEMNMEVEKMKMINKKARFRVAAAAIMVGLLMVGGGGVAYAADIGGIQRTVQLWIEGDQTDVTFEYNTSGTYQMSYQLKDGTTE